MLLLETAYCRSIGHPSGCPDESPSARCATALLSMRTARAVGDCGAEVASAAWPIPVGGVVRFPSQLPSLRWYIVRAEVRWPSGLRRYVQVVVSSGAWVRTPPSPLFQVERRVVCSARGWQRRGARNRGLTVRILAFQASGPGSTPGGCSCFSPRRPHPPFHCCTCNSVPDRTTASVECPPFSYLLGLLAKIKCSICSYQLNI